jgi:hypothetical protein
VTSADAAPLPAACGSLLLADLLRTGGRAPAAAAEDPGPRGGLSGAVQFEDRALVVRWAPVLLTTEGAALGTSTASSSTRWRSPATRPPASADALAPYFKIVAESPRTSRPRLRFPSTIATASAPRLRRRLFRPRAKRRRGRRFWCWSVTAPPAAPAAARRAGAGGRRSCVGCSEGAAEYVVERASGDGGFSPVGESRSAGARGRIGSSSGRSIATAFGGAPTRRPGLCRAALRGRGHHARGRFSRRRAVGLRAIRTPESIELSWSASPEAIWPGYRVRRDGEPLHEGLLTAPAFSDDPAPARRRRYEIVAVDRHGNTSEPGELIVE